MQQETKLALRRFALRWTRKLFDQLEEFLHAAEVRLRDEIADERANANGVPVHLPVESPGPARPQGATVSCPYPFPSDELLRHRIRGRVSLDRKPQRAAKSRHVTAAEFDLRYAR